MSRWLTSTVIKSGRLRGKQATRIVRSMVSSRPPPVLTPTGSPTLVDGHFGVENFVLRDLVQVDVDDVVLDRVMLDVEQKRQVLVDLLAGGIGQLHIDEDVFAGRGMKQRGQLLGVDFDRARTDRLVLGLAVKHAGNAAGLAHGLEGGASDAGTLGYLERDSLGHKTRG